MVGVPAIHDCDSINYHQYWRFAYFSYGIRRIENVHWQLWLSLSGPGTRRLNNNTKWQLDVFSWRQVLKQTGVSLYIYFTFAIYILLYEMMYYNDWFFHIICFWIVPVKYLGVNSILPSTSLLPTAAGLLLFILHIILVPYLYVNVSNYI